MGMPLIHAGLQLLPASISEALLDSALAAKVAKITANETNIQALNDKIGAANGIAPLGADSLIPGQYIGSVFSTEVFTVTSMAELTAAGLTHPSTGESPQRGDIAAINTGDEATQKMMILSGDDYTVAGNWSDWLSPTDGVFSLSNTSGSLANQRGAVTLADVAFSGLSAAVSYDATGDNYITSGNVDGALGELDAQTKVNADAIAQESTDRAQAITTATTPLIQKDADLQNQIDAIEGAAMLQSNYVVGEATTGAVDGSNSDYTIANSHVTGTLFLTWNGQVLYEGLGFTLNGSVATLDIVLPTGTNAPRAHYVKAGN